MRVLGYVRVSDVGERSGERFIAPAEQRETIERFVAAKRYELVDVVEDLDHSGGTLDRPGLMNVLERLENGEADAICVAYLSRLSRRVIDGLAVVRRVNDRGRFVLVSDLDLDTSTPIGRAVLTVLLAFAELELEQRRSSWSSAQRRALARGVYPGSTPLGYVRDEDGRMTPNPDTAETIRQMYDRRVAGSSWSGLARWLDDTMPRDDGQSWRPSTVADMLTTPMNIGRLERTIDGELIVIDNAHEPLVSRAVWEAVVNGKATNGAVHRSEPAVLAGLVRCAGCGGPMSRAGNGRGRPNAAGDLVRYDHYLCLARCKRQAKISIRAADGYVLASVLDRLAVSAAVDVTRGGGDEIAEVERELEHAEAELSGYLSAVNVNDVGEAAFARGARERRARVDAVRRKLASVAARVSAAGPTHTELVEQLSDPATSDGRLNVLLRAVIASVHVEKAGQPGRRGDLAERLRIVFRDEPGEDNLQLLDDVGRDGASVAA
jgi:DNA invertase Pin-like site-specific DNA recombinase